MIANNNIDLTNIKSQVEAKKSEEAASWSPLCAFFGVLFVLAFLLRLVAFYFQAGNPENLFPFTDSANYFDRALKLISGGPLGQDFFYQSNGYSLFLAMVFKLFGVQGYAVFVIQSLLGALTAAFSGLIARGCGNRAVGWLAGLGMAFYGPLIAFDFMLLSEGLAAFLFVIFLFVLLKPSADKGLAYFSVLGIIAGLTVLVRTNFLPPLLLASLWAIYTFCHTWKKWRILMVVMTWCVAFALVVAPIAILNYQNTRMLSFIPQSGGLNFFMGNHPEQEKWLAVRSYEFDKFHRLPAKEGIYEGWQQNNFFYDRTKQIIFADPVFFMQHLVKKALTFFAPQEIPNSEDLYLITRENYLLKKLVWKTDLFGFPFGFLFPFLIIGYLTWFKKLALPVHCFLLLYPLSVIIFHVSGRLRLPVVPLLMILAAMGLYELVVLVKNKKFTTFSIYLLVAISLSSATAIYSESPWQNLNFDAEHDFMRGRWLYDYLQSLNSVRALSSSVLGYKLHSHSMLKVKSLYDSAITKNPNLAAAYCNRGILLADVLSNYDLAHADFVSAIEHDPQSFTARGALGVFYLKLGKVKEAFTAFSEAIKLYPGDPKAFDGRAMAGQSFDPAGALDDLNKTLQIDPLFLSGYNNRGQFYMSRGKLHKAIEDFTQALKIDNSFSQAFNNRANAWFRLGKLEAALNDYNAAIELVANYQKALYNRAILYLQLNRPKDARNDLLKYKENGGLLEPELLNFLQRNQNH